MIEQMGKYSLLVYHKDFEEFLGKLQSKGLLDVQITASKDQKEGPNYRALQRLDYTLMRIERAKIEQEANKKNKIISSNLGFEGIKARFIDTLIEKDELLAITKDAPKVANTIIAYEQLEKFVLEQNNFIQKLNKELQDVEIWGNFSHQALDAFADSQISQYCLGFYSAPLKQFKAFPPEIPALEISQSRGLVFFVMLEERVLSPESKELFASLNLTQYGIPTYSYNEKQDQIKQEEAKLKEAQAILQELALYKADLESFRLDLLDTICFDEAKSISDTQWDGVLYRLEGFVPLSLQSDFEAFLAHENVYYLFTDAKDLEEGIEHVPIKLKNGPFASLFEVITKIFALPAYSELDLTPLFAPFFMLFFGFCFGDAGYGLIVVLVSLYLYFFKLSPENKPLAKLAFFFGLSTIFFGLLSGSFLGIDLVTLPALVHFKSWFFNHDNMMVLSLALGAVQVLFGMYVKAFNIAKSKTWRYAYGQLAWAVFFTVCIPLFALPKLLGFTLPIFAAYPLYMVLAGAIFAMLFLNTPKKNPFINLGSAVWQSYEMATGVLGDLLSYIRLFAIGLTGGILGNVFNTIAQNLSGNIPVVSTLIMLVILIFGHGLNFGISTLGSIVHPLRLTFVEFYKNAGFEGGGMAYTPFKNNKK